MFYMHLYVILYYFWDLPINLEPSASFLFFPCFRVSQKRKIKWSPIDLKLHELIFGRKATPETWSPHQGSFEEATR